MPIYELIGMLKVCGASFELSTARDGCIMVTVAVPGERWEIEVAGDGTMEIERFRSDGVIGGSELLEELARLHE